MTINHERYRKLNGDPIGVSFQDTVKILPEYKIGGLWAVFNTCAMASNNTTTAEGILFSAVGTATGIAVAKGVSDCYDWITLRRRFGKNFRDLAVDMKPDSFVPVTKPEYLKASKELRWDYSFIAFITGNKSILWGIIALAAMFDEIKYSEVQLEQKLQFGVAFMGMISAFMGTHFTRATLRHNHIAKNEWKIVDTPPPLKQEQTVSNPVTSPALN